jgi:FkbM family methyltransferase
MTTAHGGIAIVHIADFYICYNRDDHAFHHALTDTRAREVSGGNTPVQYQFGEVNPADAYGLRGIGIFSIASMFFWKHNLDFDYIDVGANVGMTAIVQAIFCKRCGAHNRVYAFEPGEVFSLLQKSVEINKVDDTTTCIRAAASDQSGKVAFHVTPAQSPASSLLGAAVKRPGVVTSYTITVDTLTLDGFIQSELRPAPGLLVKIDAEGADFRVLRGMRETLAQRLCVVQIELFPSLVDTYTDPVAELMALREHFVLIAIDDGKLSVIEPARQAISEFIERTRGKPMPAADVLFVSKRIPACDELVARILLESAGAA